MSAVTRLVATTTNCPVSVKGKVWVNVRDGARSGRGRFSVLGKDARPSFGALRSGLEPKGPVQAGEHDRREEDESERAKQHVASEPVDDEMDPEQADREDEAPIEQDVERCLVAEGEPGDLHAQDRR